MPLAASVTRLNALHVKLYSSTLARLCARAGGLVARPLLVCFGAVAALSDPHIIAHLFYTFIKGKNVPADGAALISSA